jgi:hypothetical protein
VYCGHRVIKLYGAGRLFACRHCYRLAYTSQNEGASDRWLRRANKVWQRLGDPGIAAPLPPKPKGMWPRTYERLCERACAAEIEADKVSVESRSANSLSARRSMGFVASTGMRSYWV